MSVGDQTPRGSDDDPGGVPVPTSWGQSPRRWVPGPMHSTRSPVAEHPAPRRSALTPLPEDDEAEVTPRRSAFTPGDEDDQPEVAPRRSALSPYPDEDDEAPQVAARRSAFTPVPSDDEDELVPRRSASIPDPVLPAEDPRPRRSSAAVEDPETGEEETLRLPLPRRSHEYATAARAIQPALPELGGPPAALYSPDDPEDDPSPTAEAPSPLVQPELPTAGPEPVSPFVQPEVPQLEPDLVASSVGEDTATFLFGTPSSDEHALYRRPAPGEPETQVDLTPIVFADARVTGLHRSASTEPAVDPEATQVLKLGKGRAYRERLGRRRRFAWRDHKRLLTVLSIVVGLVLIVGVGGYLFSAFGPDGSAGPQGALTLPLKAGDYSRDPSQGISPSVHPNSQIETVSATYSVNGTQTFVAIAYRPQTDPVSALAQIQAVGVTKVDGGACGRTADQGRLACAVVSHSTAVIVMTLADQTAQDLIAAASTVGDGIGT